MKGKRVPLNLKGAVCCESSTPFRPLLLKRLELGAEMKKQQNVYSDFVNGKEKQMCLLVNERKFETTFQGPFCWHYYLKIASWCQGPGAVMCDCVYCMCACVFVCVCADMSWSGWLIRAKVLLCPRHESTSVLLNCSGSCQRGAAAEPVP